MQVNKPIIDSPLLMASYVSQLAHVKCPNWANCCLPTGADAFSTPLFQQNEDGGLTYIGKRLSIYSKIKLTLNDCDCTSLCVIGCKLVPHFNTYSNWREVRIVTHSDSGSTSSMHNIPTLPRSHPWDPSVTIRAADTANHDESECHCPFHKGNLVILHTHSFIFKWFFRWRKRIHDVTKWHSNSKFRSCQVQREHRSNVDTALTGRIAKVVNW